MTDAHDTPLPPSQVSRQAIRDLPFSIVLADATRPDVPIVYVNRAFTRMTGYREEDVVGRNCRFLQGPGTSDATRAQIRRAVEAGEAITTDILNYRADGSQFVNRLTITPVRDAGGKLAYFIGIQMEKEAPASDQRRIDDLDDRLRELQHRMKNHLAMIVGLIRLQARQKDPGTIVDVLASRVQAISLLYEDFVDHTEAEGGTLDLGAYVRRIATTLHEVDGRPGIRLSADVEPLAVDVDSAGRIGLVVSEVLTNAFQHGFAGQSEGEVSVALSAGNGRARLTVTDTGRGLGDKAWPDPQSTGGRIVIGLMHQLGGELSVSRGSGGRGTRVTVAFAVPAEAPRGDARRPVH